MREAVTNAGVLLEFKFKSYDCMSFSSLISMAMSPQPETRFHVCAVEQKGTETASIRVNDWEN